MQVTTNGKLSRTYRYDAEGKLVERTNYHTDGIHIYAKTDYRYDQSRLTQQVIFLNKEYDAVERYPRTNDLVRSEQVDFVLSKDSLSWITMTAKTELSPHQNQIGTQQSFLGFEPTGALAWLLWHNGTEFELFRRESIGTSSFIDMAPPEDSDRPQILPMTRIPIPIARRVIFRYGMCLISTLPTLTIH